MIETSDRMNRWSAARGASIGAPFGEAFTQSKGHPYLSNDLLREVLSS